MNATIWHNPGCGTSPRTLATPEGKPGIAPMLADPRAVGRPFVGTEETAAPCRPDRVQALL